MVELQDSRNEAIEGFVNQSPSWKKPRTLFYLNSITFMLTMGSYTGLLDLQSSMNIEEGLGTASLFVMFGTASFSALMVTPFVTNYLGARKTLLCGYFAMLLYSASNFYPGWHTLLTSSAVMGFFESWIWVGNSKIVVYLGNEHSSVKHDKLYSLSRSQIVVARYIGYNCAFVNLGEIFGNGISHAILTSFKENHLNNHSIYNNTSSNRSAKTSWEKCGAKDCQKDYVYLNSPESGLDHYLPNKLGIQIVIAIYCFLQLTAIIIAYVFVPELPRTIFKKDTKKKYGDSVCPVFVRMYISEVKRTVIFLTKKQQLLMTFAEIYYGVFLAFQLSEFTRAYVSCTVGIEMIGRVAIFYAVGGIVVSWLCSKLAPKLGSTVAVSCLFIIHVALLGFHVVWRPLPQATVLLYFISLLCGVADGGMECLTETSISEYFPNHLANGFSAKSWANGAGLGIGFAWSTPLCVGTKLYALLGMAAVAFICWMWAERTQAKKILSRSDTESTSLSPSDGATK